MVTSSGRCTTPTSSRRPPTAPPPPSWILAVSTAPKGWCCRSPFARDRSSRWWDDGDGPLDSPHLRTWPARWSPLWYHQPSLVQHRAVESTWAACRTRPSTSRPTGGLGSVPGMETAAIQEFQMHGQDIPWLLQHWADAQARPSRAGLGAARRRRQAAGPTPSCVGHPRDLAAGLRDRGIEHRRQGPDPRRQLPRDAARVARLRDGRRRGRHHQHTLGRRRGRRTSSITRSASPRSRSPQFVGAWSAPRPSTLLGSRSSATDRGEPERRRRRHGSTLRRRSYGDAADVAGRPIEPLRPFGIMFTSGTTNKPKAVVHTHANAVWASRIGPRNIDLQHRRPLPDLPAAVPRQRAELVDVLGARRRRHRGAHAEWSTESLLGRRRRATTSRTSR